MVRAIPLVWPGLIRKFYSIFLGYRLPLVSDQSVWHNGMHPKMINFYIASMIPCRCNSHRENWPLDSPGLKSHLLLWVLQ